MLLASRAAMPPAIKPKAVIISPLPNTPDTLRRRRVVGLFFVEALRLRPTDRLILLLI
jgi:hypothetical protein